MRQSGGEVEEASRLPVVPQSGKSGKLVPPRVVPAERADLPQKGDVLYRVCVKDSSDSPSGFCGKSGREADTWEVVTPLFIKGKGALAPTFTPTYRGCRDRVQDRHYDIYRGFPLADDQSI
jgi:hypothetical protein